ncbi:hypothetical protein ACWDO7_28170 [Streptomyces sp. NPDC003656]
MDLSGDGAALGPEWQTAGNNVCGVLRGWGDVSRAAARFVRAGWWARSSDWESYEVGTEWCAVELTPVGGSEVLLNGVVDPGRLDDLVVLLSGPGVGFGVELYDGRGELCREVEGGR